MVADRRDENLRLVLQAAEGLGVDDAVAIDLIRGPHRIGFFGSVTVGTFA
jgi:hypothetical protein